MNEKKAPTESSTTESNNSHRASEVGGGGVGFNAMLVGSGMNGVAGKVPGNKSLAIGRNLGCMRFER